MNNVSVRPFLESQQTLCYFKMYVTWRTALKFNKAILSSAAVEHLFSIDIFRSRRATLSDANFLKQMFMKGNHHHVETMEKPLIMISYAIRREKN